MHCFVSHPPATVVGCRTGQPALRTPLFARLNQRRSLHTIAAGGGSGPIGAWLDLAALVTSGAAKAPGVNEFADTVGRDIYIDVAGWHLYLKDCKMSVGVASALAQKVAATGGKVSETDVRDVCAKIAVPLGGGRSTLSLSDVMPERCVQDLTDITRRFANKEL